jgi:serine/threonine protein kinase
MQGLEHLHSDEVQMLHRDLKPSNVLVQLEERPPPAAGGGADQPASSEPEPCIRICDMGLSKRRGREVSMSTLGKDVGTQGWKPPELCACDDSLGGGGGGTTDLSEEAFKAGAAADVFSAGLVIFSLLSGGAHPFDPRDGWGGGSSSGGGAGAAGGGGVERRLHVQRQARIERWGAEWRAACPEERARIQSEFLEQLQVPWPLLPLSGAAEPEPEPEPPVGLRRRAVGVAEQVQAALTPEASSLIWSMLHPDPAKRPSARQTLKDSYFTLFELQDEDEIPFDQLAPMREIGRGAFGEQTGRAQLIHTVAHPTEKCTPPRATVLPPGVVCSSTYRGTDVAVKRIFSHDARAPAKLAALEESFCRETQILRKLRHPNVVLFLGWCRSSHGLCIVTELCVSSLHRQLYPGGGGGGGAQREPLATLRRASIAVDAANGLAFLHASDPPIVHRDIKPGNILLDRAYRAKVCDFGLARQGHAADAGGTPQYHLRVITIMIRTLYRLRSTFCDAVTDSQSYDAEQVSRAGDPSGRPRSRHGHGRLQLWRAAVGGLRTAAPIRDAAADREAGDRHPRELLPVRGRAGHRGAHQPRAGPAAGPPRRPLPLLARLQGRAA